MNRIISIYDRLFFRFILLMSKKKNDYDYGMTLVLFTYSTALFVLPLLFLSMRSFHFTAGVMLWSFAGGYTLIWISNYVMTKERHKLISDRYYSEATGMKKYSILLMTLVGMVFSISVTLVVLRR